MPLQTIVLATVIAGIGCAQYILMTHAIRDLIRRPRVRGGNKVTWGLAILCLPIAGALIYAWMGPASFIRRAPFVSAEAVEREVPSTTRPADPVRAANSTHASRSMPSLHPKVTPIRGARAPSGTRRPGSSPSTVPSRARRTGS